MQARGASPRSCRAIRPAGTPPGSRGCSQSVFGPGSTPGRRDGRQSRRRCRADPIVRRCRTSPPNDGVNGSWAEAARCPLAPGPTHLQPRDARSGRVGCHCAREPHDRQRDRVRSRSSGSSRTSNVPHCSSAPPQECQAIPGDGAIVVAAEARFEVDPSSASSPRQPMSMRCRRRRRIRQRAGRSATSQAPAQRHSARGHRPRRPIDATTCAHATPHPSPDSNGRGRTSELALERCT